MIHRFFFAGKAALWPGASLCLSILSLVFLSACASKKTTFDIPEGSSGIVAYGSLISTASLEQSLGKKYAGRIEPVHLTAYERAWSCVRSFDDGRAPADGRPKMKAFLRRGEERVPIACAAELNIFPNKTGRINGILYVLSPSELADLDKREWGYRRVDVTDRIEEFRFRGGKVYVYEGLPGPSASGEPPASAGLSVLFQEFRDSVLAACDAVGKDFRADFEASTKAGQVQIVSVKDIAWEMGK